jgi:hypothetical protein
MRKLTRRYGGQRGGFAVATQPDQTLRRRLTCGIIDMRLGPWLVGFGCHSIN